MPEIRNGIAKVGFLRRLGGGPIDAPTDAPVINMGLEEIQKQAKAS